MKPFKTLLFISFIILYLFILIGLFFHTSQNPEIFGKYSRKYFQYLIMLVPLFWVYLTFLKFSFKTHKIRIGKHSIELSPLSKFFVYIILLFCLLMPLELFIRYKNLGAQSVATEFSIHNFHPFLQYQMTREDNNNSQDLNINYHGFRGENITQSKPNNTYRIFLIGGSTVLNRKVSYNDNVSKLLQNLLQSQFPDKKIEVLNAGVETYTTEHSIIQYMFHIRDFEPDLLIGWQGINDMNESCTQNLNSFGEYKSDYSHNFNILSQMVSGYFNTKTFSDVRLLRIMRQLSDSILYSDLKNAWLSKVKVEKKYSEMNFPSIDSYKRNLRYLINLTNLDGVQLILGDQPYLYNTKLDGFVKWNTTEYCKKDSYYPSTLTLINGIEKFNEATRQLAESTNTPFIHLAQKLPKTREYFLDDVHFTGKSNKIIAESLFETIIDKQFIQ